VAQSLLLSRLWTITATFVVVGVFQIMCSGVGSAMIPWQTIVDPDHGLHECKAHVAGIDFYIWRAIGRRFGISARRRLPNGTSEQLTHSGDIEWYDTLEECKARAERILHAHQVRVQ
jgi:hypothetical protein